MSSFYLRRIVQSLIAVWGVVTIVFFILHLSGDPTLLLAPQGASRADIDALRHQLGYDRPLYTQYFEYLNRLVHLDLGDSVVQRTSVLEIIAARVPYTFTLAGGAALVALGIGLPMGILMALYRGTVLERVLMGVVLVGQSMPTFWSGILLILFFAVRLRWFPSSGAEGLGSLILPSVALGALSMATFARITRISVLGELGQDYVRTAKARGVGRAVVILKHVLRNAAIPIVSVLALELGNLLAGAVIVETVFAWPGIGQLAVQSIFGRDFLVVQGIVLLGSFVYIVLNFLADAVYGLIDPRIRLSGTRDKGKPSCTTNSAAFTATQAVAAAVARFAVVAVLVIVAVLAPLVAPYPPTPRTSWRACNPQGPRLRVKPIFSEPISLGVTFCLASFMVLEFPFWSPACPCSCL